jgi:hypothetical protein
VTAFVQHRCMDYIRDHPESKLTVVRLLDKMHISSNLTIIQLGERSRKRHTIPP